MKTKTHTLMNMLLAILSIVLLIIGVSEGSWVLIVLGVLCFGAILIIRGRQISKMNREIEQMKEEIPHETDNPDDE